MNVFSRYGELRKWFRNDKYLFFLTVPGLLILFLFHYLPMFGIVISFMDYNPFHGIAGSPWVGFKHFVHFVEDPYFFRIVRNTFLLGVYTLLFAFPVPIVLALLLNEVKWTAFKRITQTISYLPYFISTVVVIGILKTFVSLDGFLNTILQAFGVEPIIFLMEANWFRTLYIGSGIWQSAGFGAIIYLAALAGVDTDMYEAASIDGANRWQKLVKITVPAIVPTIVVMFILAVGGILGNDFTKIFLLYSPSTYETADVISTYVYRQGLQNANFSYSSAIGLMNSVMSFVFLIMANLLSRKLSDHSLW